MKTNEKIRDQMARYHSGDETEKKKENQNCMSLMCKSGYCAILKTHTIYR